MATNNAINNSLSNIYDANGNIVLILGPEPSAVNFVGITNNSIGAPPVIDAEGSDSNINLVIRGKGTGGMLAKGFTNGSSIAAGSVGEVMTSNIPFASAISLTSTVAADVTHLALTAGNWLVFGNVFLNFPSNTGSAPDCWISTTSATIPDFSKIIVVNLVSSLFGSIGMTAASLTLNVSSTTNVYLSCGATFASGTGTACGTLNALRVS